MSMGIPCNYGLGTKRGEMPSKDKLLKKLKARPSPTNYTVRELDSLMKKCGCRKYLGG